MTTEVCQVDKSDLNISKLGNKQFAYFNLISHAINIGIIVNNCKHCKTVLYHPHSFMYQITANMNFGQIFFNQMW